MGQLQAQVAACAAVAICTHTLFNGDRGAQCELKPYKAVLLVCRACFLFGLTVAVSHEGNTKTTRTRSSARSGALERRGARCEAEGVYSYGLHSRLVALLVFK